MAKLNGLVARGKPGLGRKPVQTVEKQTLLWPP